VIRWLLERLNESPGRTFYETELRARDETGFESIRANGLLSAIPDLVAGQSYDWMSGTRLLTVVSGKDGELEAIDLEDPSFRAIQLTDVMRRQWRVDEIALMREIRAANQVDGPSEVIAPRVWLLGQRSLDDGSLACCLGFVRRGHFIQTLASLPALLGDRFAKVLVATLAGPSNSEDRLLRTMGIETSSLDETNPLIIQSLPMAEGHFYDSGIYRSDDYSRVVWKGVPFSFLAAGALIIRSLHRASKTLNPEVRESTLVAELHEALLSDASDIRDVLRRSGAWKTLVVQGKRPGFYRLNLP
jgi:hypothetical protein